MTSPKSLDWISLDIKGSSRMPLNVMFEFKLFITEIDLLSSEPCPQNSIL